MPNTGSNTRSNIRSNIRFNTAVNEYDVDESDSAPDFENACHQIKHNLQHLLVAHRQLRTTLKVQRKVQVSLGLKHCQELEQQCEKLERSDRSNQVLCKFTKRKQDEARSLKVELHKSRSEVAQLRKLLKETKRESEETRHFICRICYYRAISVVTGCGLGYCISCMNTWLNLPKKTCPGCRATIRKLQRIYCGPEGQFEAKPTNQARNEISIADYYHRTENSDSEDSNSEDLETEDSDEDLPLIQTNSSVSTTTSEA